MAVRYVRIGQHPDYRDEVRGTLAEILAAPANPGAFAVPEDVTGCFLEMGADGKWAGPSVGNLTQAQADALVASGAMASVAVGTQGMIGGVQTAIAPQGDRARVAFLGDSIAAASGSHLNQAATAMGYIPVGFYAVASTKIEDQRAKIPSILASRCGTVFLHVGTNNYADSGATLFSKYMTLFGDLRSAGLEVVVTLPGANAGLMAATYSTRVACYFAASKFGFKVYDPLGQFATSAGLWAAGASLDNLHPTSSARGTAGTTLAQSLQACSTALPTVLSNADSLLANGCFATDTNADGLSDNWELSATAITGTVVTSREQESGALGHYKQVLKITNPAINDSKSIYQQITTSAGYAPGDVLMCVMRYDYSRPAGVSAVNLDPCVPAFTIQGAKYGFPQVYNNILGVYGADIVGGVAVGFATVDETYTDVRVNANIRAYNTPPAGDYVLKLYRVGLINLTSMGIVP